MTARVTDDADRLWFTRHGDALLATDDEARKAVRMIGAGEIVSIQIDHARNLERLRLYWKLLHTVVESGSKYPSAPFLHTEMKIRLGLFDEHLTAEGELVYVPRSIAFHKMSEAEFRDYFDRLIRLICTDIVPGLKEEHLRAQVLQVITGGGG